MERLTERYDNVPGGESDIGFKDRDYVAAAERLAYYEDLEEQGLLLKLQHKIGDIIWDISLGDVRSCQIIGFGIMTDFHCTNSEMDFIFTDLNTTDLGRCSDNAFGDTVFITEEEAEKKLKELNNKV